MSDPASDTRKQLRRWQGALDQETLGSAVRYAWYGVCTPVIKGIVGGPSARSSVDGGRTHGGREPDQGRRPTALWRPGQTVTDAHELQLPADLPPGKYRILAGLYVAPDGPRLPVVGRQDGAIEVTALDLP